MLPLRVSDVKQYAYCPRVVYYTYVLPVERRMTGKMEFGAEMHLELDRLEKRRKLRSYGLEQGTRQFHVRLQSDRLGLSGVLDLLIVSPGGRFPVEFKYVRGRPSLNHKYQLTAYAMLVEDVFGEAVRVGFVYLIPVKEIVPLEITPAAREHVAKLLRSIRSLIRAERMPPPARVQGRCVDCEYRKYCGDVEAAGGEIRVLPE
ncbi:MAG: CRISPR-associated protein Cas4 [bacterium]|nr:CRISPR-associated protein Cas4 [bacterium]